MFWTLPVLAAIWVPAFFLFPGFAHPMSPTLTAAQVAGFYRDPAHLSRIRYSMILFNWFGVGLVPLLTLLVLQVKRMAHQTPILSYCLLGCAAGGPAVFLVADIFWLLAAFQPGRDPQLTLMFNGLISWWINMAVFGLYTGAFIMQLRNLILREDFGDGPLPSLSGTAP